LHECSITLQFCKLDNLQELRKVKPKGECVKIFGLNEYQILELRRYWLMNHTELPPKENRPCEHKVWEVHIFDKIKCTICGAKLNPTGFEVVK